LIYEARNKGKSLAQRFLETGPDLPPDEEMLLRAAAASKASLYRIVDVNKPSAQVRMHDLLCERPDVLVTDIHMSSSCKCRYLFFDRFLETPDAAMCSGAGISFLPEDEPLLLKKYKRVEKVGNPALRILKCYALFFEMEKQSGIKTYYA